MTSRRAATEPRIAGPPAPSTQAVRRRAGRLDSPHRRRAPGKEAGRPEATKPHRPPLQRRRPKHYQGSPCQEGEDVPRSPCLPGPRDRGPGCRWARTDTDRHGLTRTRTDRPRARAQATRPVEDCAAASPAQWVTIVPWPAVLLANAALSILNLACHLLDRQIQAQATAFQQDGGFTVRLHRARCRARSSGAGKR